MRYHFVTFSDEYYDATASYVLFFLKHKLDSLRKSDKKNNYTSLETFVTDYITSLLAFVKSLGLIIDRVGKQKKYFKLFSILNLSATLYPLITKLEMLGVPYFLNSF